MNRDLFDGLPHFLAVARHGGFTAAAEALDISPTAMSKAIRALETRYQTRLFQRTKGASRPTSGACKDGSCQAAWGRVGASCFRHRSAGHVAVGPGSVRPIALQGRRREESTLAPQLERELR